MANKIKKQLQDWLRWFREGRTTAKEVVNELNEIETLIYRMWQHDLISDKVKDDCFKITKDFAWNNHLELSKELNK